ncbi:MAG: MATE family efflux transporter [Phycisphaerae bacterium]
MLGEQFVNFLLGVVDTWLAGHISKEATGAVGMATYLGWLSGLIFMLVGSGAAALVSRSIGAGDRATANRALHQAFLMALVFGVLASQLMFHGAALMAGFFAPSPAARVLFEQFIRIDAWGYVLYALLLTCGGVCRAAGDTRTPMRVMIAVNLVNIVIASGLVFGWFGERWGVAGIATGTLIARCIGGVLMTVVMVRGHLGMRLSLAGLMPDFGIMWRMLRVGLPALADGGLMFAAQLAFIRIIAHSDASAEQAAANFAAHTIAMRIEAITYLPAVAWMTAAATLVGQFLGAGKPHLATRAGHLAAAQGAVLGALSCVLFFTLADPIFRLMSSDPAVHAAGAGPFRMLAFAQPFLCIAIVYIGALRGAGDTRTTMIFSLVGGLLLRVPVAYLFASVLGWGLLGAWMGMWADNVAKATMSFARFVQGGWKRMKV